MLGPDPGEEVRRTMARLGNDRAITVQGDGFLYRTGTMHRVALTIALGS
ncbi:hypothetical protein O1Q96_27625 [Streptomyces sp. Qhu-G9]|nr:hypothetical protein [Streptomyces aurantiacus]WAU86680.1 hypothetical protein O1Q96_27625 [Streptomyces aurantiacus]